MSDRLAAARSYVEKKPDDRFGLYALAMELRKTKAWEECFRTFDTLIAKHPAHGAGWYHYAMARRESGDRDGCLGMLRRGLDATRAAGDTHTAAEIEAAIDEMDG